ncbi:MAG: phosphonate C-P lyase system protein PhnH [Pseudomonadota bacterium]
MLAAPVPSPVETCDNQAFDALLWALSRPGLPKALPEAGEAPIIAALLDRECRVYSADPLLMPDILRTGAEIADVDQADHVFLGAPQTSETLQHVAIGSDLYPDDGATVILRVSLNTGPTLRLSGPGIDGHLTIQIDGLPDGFWDVRAVRIRYPMGFDLFLVDGASVIGLPRSTKVETL